MGNCLAEKLLHAKIFVEGEGEHLELDITPCQFRDELSAEQIGVGAGDEYRVPTFSPKGIDHFFKVGYILHLVYEEVCFALFGCAFVYQFFQLVGSLDFSVFSQVQVEIYDVVVVNAVFVQLLRDGFH